MFRIQTNLKKFPNYRQRDGKDCGAACLKIVAEHYGKVIPIEHLRQWSETTRTGSTLANISDAAEHAGLRSLGAKVSLTDLKEAPLPCILHWDQTHFVVLYKIAGQKKTFYVSDPGHGRLRYTEEEFISHWIDPNCDTDTPDGIVLLLEPTSKFYLEEYDEPNRSVGWSLVGKYLIRYQKFIWQLIIGLVVASLIQLAFPFFTQAIVDVGIKNQDINFIYLILFAQLALFLGRSVVEVLRSWILLHLSTRINISLVSDFFMKLMKLPIAYFDTKMTGDILQRINDHSRIERILTTSSLNTLFSFFNVLVFASVLAYYNLMIFAIFALGSLAYFLWIAIFLKKRKEIDYKKFSQMSQEQSRVIEMINGMQTIKLHNAERQKRWGWEYVQARIFRITVDSLSLEQYQSVGSGFINELKNILITILAATLVIDGEITLGMMLAISFIVGQLNAPASQLINFIKEFQDARISLDRLNEIHSKEEEDLHTELDRFASVPTDAGFELRDVSFRYTGSDTLVLKDLSVGIPKGKVTAIVGASGSGKTTLLKLLLKYYDPIEGSVRFGEFNFKQIPQKQWRAVCGAVMQEDYLFNDTIANNIAIGVDRIDYERLLYSVKTANIDSFIETLPLGFNTRIGMEGLGLSVGQKQRILIARAVYKDPQYLFLDEATSSLDANNEREIMEQLECFFKDRTVVIIAHRLSTVKHADQILVLDSGNIVEVGTHNDLVLKRGYYFRLVKNQLELGN